MSGPIDKTERAGRDSDLQQVACELGQQMSRARESGYMAGRTQALEQVGPWHRRAVRNAALLGVAIGLVAGTLGTALYLV